MSNFRSQVTVYEHDFRSFGRSAVLSGDEEFVCADKQSISAFFFDDPRLAARFLAFVKIGFRGFFITRGREWVTYGWFSVPHGEHPYHLPRWTRNLDACWVFYCHTKKSFRGHGYFAKLLRQMVLKVGNDRLASNIYIDTRLYNAPSRRAILSAGFTPCGVITTYQLWLPHWGNVFTIGKWRRGEVHPPLQSSSPEHPPLVVSELTR